MRTCGPIVGGWMLLAALLVVPGGGPRRAAAESVECGGRRGCRAQDEAWLVSTRCLSDCPDTGAAPRLDYRRWDGGRWVESDAVAFAASIRDSAAPSVTRVWVHGNRIDSATAVDVGWMAYDVLVPAEAPPVRYVIWSWPSDKIRGQLRDVRYKAHRADADSYYLAHWLRQFSPGQSVDVGGYSYGGRVVTGALHLVGGGEYQGWRLPEQPRPALRAILLAPALDKDWLLPDHRHGQALAASEGLLSLYNPGDPVLKWFHLAVCDRCSQALGYVGLRGEQLGDQAAKLIQQNVSGSIGRVHDWQVYLSSLHLRASIHDFLSRRPETIVSPTR